jgi:hypothetical protein
LNDLELNPSRKGKREFPFNGGLRVLEKRLSKAWIRLRFANNRVFELFSRCVFLGHGGYPPRLPSHQKRGSRSMAFGFLKATQLPMRARYDIVLRSNGGDYSIAFFETRGRPLSELPYSLDRSACRVASAANQILLLSPRPAHAKKAGMPDSVQNSQEIQEAASRVERARALLQKHRQFTGRDPEWQKEDEECIAHLTDAEQELARVVDRHNKRPKS